jgi:hypothetical protein
LSHHHHHHLLSYHSINLKEVVVAIDHLEAVNLVAVIEQAIVILAVVIARLVIIIVMLLLVTVEKLREFIEA